MSKNRKNIPVPDPEKEEYECPAASWGNESSSCEEEYLCIPEDGGEADDVGYGDIQAEGVWREHQEGRADPGHEQGRYERDPEQFFLLRQINGQRP